MTSPPTIDPTPAYRDAERPVGERVDDLLARMTLPEKVAQLGSAWVFELADGMELRPETGPRLADGLGQVTRISGASNLAPCDAAEVANRIQRVLVAGTRLGIPAIVHEEVCAGLTSRDATVFPQPIGLASTWNPALVEEMAGVVRAEARAIGAHQGLSPVLDVCRDPRWGRLEETFGEDPHLVAMMGVAFVRGLQGDDLTNGVVATAKHLVGYGASEGGLNWAPAHLPPRELAEVYLHPFEAAVRVGGLRSVMNGYHELDGVPCGANRELLTDLLRDQWGFDGCVVADYFSIRQLETYHQLVDDGVAAAELALTAGIDVELPSTDCYGPDLVAAVTEGAIDGALVDAAVARVLRTKFELGLFERPYVDVVDAPSKVGAVESRRLARRAAEESLILLANDGILPLDPATTGTVAVIGPNADSNRALLGDYSYAAQFESLLEARESSDENVFGIPVPDDLRFDAIVGDGPTVATALVQSLPQARVVTAPGCTPGGDDRSGIAEAVELAAEADIAVLVMGDLAGLTLDATSGESRDRSSLDLPGVQEELVHAVLDTGTPVVLVLISGRPCGSPTIHERSRAVLAAWLPGVDGGAAIADALAGLAEPGGHLPISFPRSAGHVPVYYRHKVSGGRSYWKEDYVDGPVTPLYPFGHGLGYTTIELSPAAPTPAQVPPGGAVTITVMATNTGQRAGSEVIQLYTRDPRAALTRPVLELKAFHRVQLVAGEEREIRFTVPVDQLGFRDRDLRYVVEPGEIEIHVGTSAAETIAAGSFTISPDSPDLFTNDRLVGTSVSGKRLVEVDEVFHGAVDEVGTARPGADDSRADVPSAGGEAAGSEE
jgi:beta-glucosidase